MKKPTGSDPWALQLTLTPWPFLSGFGGIELARLNVAARRRRRGMRDGRLVGPRVRLVVHLFHPTRRQVRVDLRRAERLMPEQLLHASQIGAVVEQVRREAVP